MIAEPGRAVTFAVPGDLETCTGGTLYDRRLGAALQEVGYDLRYLRLGDSFPHPGPEDMADALARLASLPPDCPALVDGLAYGALDTAVLARVSAPLVALVHHPLALEPGLSPAAARDMAARESANLALARHILVTGPHVARLLQSEYAVAPDRISVARPGFIPLPVTDAAPRATPPLILSVGLLAERKGHDILLRALAALTDLDWQAEIVGRHHERETVCCLMALRADLGLERHVRLAGEVSQDRLDMLYRRADVFALATRYEGYGLVFDEAMGHGLPIVSTRAGAVPDTVPGAAGALVAPEDPDAFAAALRGLLTNRTRHAACAEAARRAAAALPGWDAAAEVAADALFAQGARDAGRPPGVAG